MFFTKLISPLQGPLKRQTVLRTGDPQQLNWKTYKDTNSYNDYDPHRALKNKGIVEIGGMFHAHDWKQGLPCWKGPTWLFDLDYLTDSMNYHPVRSENQANIHAGQQEANHNAGTEDIIDAGDSEKEDESAQDCFVLPIWSSYSSTLTPDLKTDEKKEVADFTNLETVVNVSPIPTSRIISSHPSALILGDPTSAVQTRSKVNKKALEDESWVDAMQEELLQFEIQKVWILVDLPYGKKAIGTKWVYRNKKDERGVVVRNKARLVAQGHRQEEGIDYDEVFAPVARIEAIRIFLAFASYMGFIVYQMDVKSAFLYGKIDEIMATEEDKYVTRNHVKRFDFANVKTASTPIETQKPLVKDEEASDVDVHLYRSMIGSLMLLDCYLGQILCLQVCACFLVSGHYSKVSPSPSLSVVKRIFRYLKGKPKLGLWYPRVSSFDLESYSDSDYAGANLDRKSTTGGCQFLGRRLISWQCKKQTIVATSTTEAEYVAAASCCGQVLWIQNQMLDYGFNFMNTKIYIDNESTICIVKNPVYHSKTKHIAIR
ncbi:putative ribonuclease H-like domain-containing protein [Tanacetum coccineum]|uniref:Ribonuclease H-like domain-containing protein n=1 Tax=Tanacetum coccineum TaxID=301880 RepID=A0ABQ4YKF7_9ASTR